MKPPPANVDGATYESTESVPRKQTLSLKRNIKKVQQQLAVAAILKPKPVKPVVPQLIRPIPRLRRIEEKGIYAIDEDNDYVDMSKPKILASMHPYRKANQTIIKQINPKAEFELSEEEVAEEKRRSKSVEPLSDD